MEVAKEHLRRQLEDNHDIRSEDDLGTADNKIIQQISDTLRDKPAKQKKFLQYMAPNQQENRLSAPAYSLLIDNAAEDFKRELYDNMEIANGQDLQVAEDDTVSQIASRLKPAKKKKFLELLGLAALPVESASKKQKL